MFWWFLTCAFKQAQEFDVVSKYLDQSTLVISKPLAKPCLDMWQWRGQSKKASMAKVAAGDKKREREGEK